MPASNKRIEIDRPWNSWSRAHPLRDQSDHVIDRDSRHTKKRPYEQITADERITPPARQQPAPRGDSLRPALPHLRLQCDVEQPQKGNRIQRPRDRSYPGHRSEDHTSELESLAH